MIIARPYCKGSFICSCLLFVAFILGTSAIGQTWTTANAGNWSNPATWTSNSIPPTGSTMGIVTIVHSVTLDQNAIAGTLNINSGVLTVSGTKTLAVTGTATIGNGAVFTNSSSNAANISINSFVVSNGGTYNHDAVGSSPNGASTDFPGTTRSFGASSNVVIIKWAQSGAITPAPLPASGSPGWGNLTISIDNTLTFATSVSPYSNGVWNQFGNLTNVQGNFSVTRTGTVSPNEFRFFGQATNASLVIKGDVNISGGRVAMIGDGFGSGKTVTITVKGNFNLSGSSTFDLTSSYGNLGGFHFTYLYLEGDLLIQNSAKFQRYRTNTTNGIAFVKPSGIQTFNSHAAGLNTGNPGIGFRVGNGTTTNTLRLLTPFLSLQTVTSTFPNLGNRFEVYSNASLDCSAENYLQGWGFTTSSGSTLKIGSKDGIETIGASAKGSIRMISTTYGTMYHSGANYIYTGAYNQVTGNGLPTTITASLGISNTGAVNNNTVTLTTNNTETKTLNLNSGYFAAGTAQTLKISNSGTINGTAGGDCIHLTANGGNIHLLGNNTVTGSASGYPHFYDVTIGSGILNSPVTFSQNGTIYHYCTINSEGAVNPKAPAYATGSTLIYNTANTAASPYNRSIEWGQATAGDPGYPWHVLVKNGTNLNLGTTSPPLLECGGNLTIGILGGGSGTVNMNSLIQPLIVKGHLTIGDTITGSPIGTLNLSNANGGDLHLYGNFSRGKNSFYNDNSRAIYFKGSNDASISTPAVSITPGVPTQYFSYCRIDKTSGTEIITLRCPVGINNGISFIKGVVTSSATNLMSVTNSSTGSVIGGSDLAFVNGPLTRAVNSTNEYGFPVGKTGAPNSWRPVSVIPATTGASVFWAEYFKGPTPNNSVLLGSISSLENNEYWHINRSSGSAAAVVKLNYEYPGTGTSNWTPIDPCSDCNVSVAQYQVSGTGYWDLTTNISSLGSAVPQARLNESNGPLYSAQLSNFSLSQPITAAATFNIILPVNLVSFSGKQVAGDGNLEWKVSDAKDLDGFELEFSRDGRRYERLATIKSNGTAVYHYLHAFLGAGANYYRLLVKDKSGKAYYSKVVLLYVGENKTFLAELVPIAVNGQLSPVIFSAKNQAVQAMIVDVPGRKISTQKSMLQTGTNQLRIQIHLLPKGMYFIELTTEDGMKETRKFIKE